MSYGGELSGWMIVCELKMTVKWFLGKSYELMNEWMNEWMNERMNEQKNEWMDEKSEEKKWLW